MTLRRAFTLIEVLATLLLLAIGVMSVVGLVRYGTRVSLNAQMRATALLVADTVAVDPTPGGKTADAGDADGDGWGSSGTVASPATGDYSFTVRGSIDGYYLRRTEESTVADVIDPTMRWVQVTVDVFASDEDRFLTSIRRRLLRQTRNP